jgi:hypothetical protein
LLSPPMNWKTAPTRLSDTFLSVPTSLAELDINFYRKDRCYFTSAYMAVLAECLSNASLTSISITHGHMSAAGLGNLLESQGRTLQSLRLCSISFGDGDNSVAMFNHIRASTMLNCLELDHLTHGNSIIAMDWKAPSCNLSARGKAAHYMACYSPWWFQECQQMAYE